MSLTKPYTFSSGTVIASAQVNSDFDTLFTAIGNQMYTEENYIADDQTVTASLDALDMKVKDHADYYPDLMRYSIFQRAPFTYNGGATAYTVKVGAAAYWCKDKFCYWTSELTTGAIGTPVADTWYYLYLDYSEITSGTAIVAAKLIWSSTAPTWNGTYRGWYNSDDRCIFAALTNAGPTNIMEFLHEGGDEVVWADDKLEANSISPDSFTDVDIATSVPGFSRRASMLFYVAWAQANTLWWRTNGQTGSTGHKVAQCGTFTAGDTSANTLTVMTDTAQIFEMTFTTGGADALLGYVQSWFFPVGM